MILSYLFYLPFDTWAFLRFLLPAIRFCSRWLPTVVYALNRIAPDMRLPVAVLAVGAAVVWRMDLARGAFDFDTEQPCVTAAQHVADRFPPNAVLLTMQHSGLFATIPDA